MTKSSLKLERCILVSFVDMMILCLKKIYIFTCLKLINNEGVEIIVTVVF
jgi:hypothetical protein